MRRKGVSREVKPTMRDVAIHANVSVATVSHVINNTRFVSPETRAQVMDSIAKLGYTPDIAARSFKTGRRNLIAFIVPDIANPFFATLIEEAESVLNREGYRLLVVNTKENPERELDSLRALSSGVVDGFLLASTLDSYTPIENALSGKEPVVFVDRRVNGCPLDTVTVASYQALYQGVTHLIESGHRRIGFITGLPRISTTVERLQAYRDAMTQHGLMDEGLIRVGDSMSHCVKANLFSLIDAGCTSLVIPNNLMATEAMTLLLDAGISPGRDIELLGFRDSDQAQYGLHQMHLVVQPTAELGRAAAGCMLKRLKTPDTPWQEEILKASFRPHE